MTGGVSPTGPAASSVTVSSKDSGGRPQAVDPLRPIEPASSTEVSAKGEETSADAEMLSGWGGLGRPGREVVGEDFGRLTRGRSLSRGLGRSYGDSSLPAPGSDGSVAGSRLSDRFLSFDPSTGILRAEAGLSLAELQRVFLPQGFTCPVLTGTQFVTLGGMVASDVHGKNHHVSGTFGQHVQRLWMRLADDRLVYCSPQESPDLFWATVGGMGLTGHILEVEVRLERITSPWIWCETERMPHLDAFLHGLQEAARDWPMTMGWIDCLTRGPSMGRGILYRGRWATAEEAPPEPPQPKRRLAVPFNLPSWTLNPLTVRAFNFLVYRKHIPHLRRGVMHPESFFHPLDFVHAWNRIYGRRGFTQYQCVIPQAAGSEGVRRFLSLLTELGLASFLCVIKDCGAEGQGMLSFPQPGTSIALDIPVRSGTEAAIARLNLGLIELGGRIYLTKDAFTSAQHFAAMEPRLAAWRAVQAGVDPERRLASAQSARMFGISPRRSARR